MRFSGYLRQGGRQEIWAADLSRRRQGGSPAPSPKGPLRCLLGDFLLALDGAS
jgi:hypothetical protein